MLNHLDRKILKYIMEEKHPVSNKELALSCNVAINTIRKEIALINEEMEKHGVSIASKTSVGNYLEIADRTLAGPYLEKCGICATVTSGWTTSTHLRFIT